MKVTEKGQVTIPIHVREQLGIRPGDDVDIEVVDGVAQITRGASTPSFGQRMRQRAKGVKTRGLSTDELMALTRGE